MRSPVSRCTEIQYQVHAARRVVQIAELGPSRRVPRESADLLPGRAEIDIRIGGQEQRMTAAP